MKQKRLRLLKLKAEAEKQRLILENYKQSNRIEFFQPLEHQQKIIDYLHAGKKTILLVGGNRVGKTTCGAAIVASAVLGIQPWDKKETVWGKQPVKVRILCTNWEDHAAQVIVPALKEWLPAGSYTTGKNNVGVEAEWHFKNGSEIRLITGKQDVQQHEGWKGHLVWQDEPTGRDKYVANKRGLIDYSGVYLMTFTAVSESWVLDDIVLSDDDSVGCVTEVPTYANRFLKKEDIEAFEKTLTPEEKVARIQGGWLNLVGRVLKDFNRDIHIIEPFKVPTDWPVVVQIDLHLSKPQALGFYAVDKQDRWYGIDEIWENMGPEEIADEIIRRKNANSWRIVKAEIDPLSKGDNAYIKNRVGTVEDSFTIIKRKLSAQKIPFDVASKDKESGVRNIQNRLKGANRMPSLFFFNTLKRHLFEIARWVYDDDGKPKKENDDMMECLYRKSLMGVKYTDPQDRTKAIDFSAVSKGIV